MAINIQNKEQTSERAINSREPPPKTADRTSELQDWRAAPYELVRNLRR